LSRHLGRFEFANHGTIFLDEISELSLEAQVKLLRVIEERVIERLGSPTPIKIDVRIIAASNRDLEQAVQERTFREDLLYRLNVFPVAIPPLRERPEDIPLLAWTFAEQFSRAFGKRVEEISRESLTNLQRYEWPGNVRELRNLVERAVIVASGPTLVLEPSPLPAVSKHAPSNLLMDLAVRDGRLEQVEAAHIRTVLERVQWRVRGAGAAAEVLGLRPTTLESRMARLGIHRPASSVSQPRPSGATIFRVR
jgi:formate hydrogenlyase transcriptional activator